ncbi:MAG: hypothetical protein KGH74_03520 [Candidatus Micrarchaeota archaeon]|nr:hypothetical protein [Candidatus Micrarchaeota archaeon]
MALHKNRLLLVFLIFLLFVGAVSATIYSQNIIETINTVQTGADYYQGIIECSPADDFYLYSGEMSAGQIYDPTVQAYLYANFSTGGTIYQDVNIHSGINTNNITAGSTSSDTNFRQTLPQCTTILVVPCTWFQLQCWWYPTLFFGLYLGVFTLVARKAEITRDGTLYMELAALNAAAAAQTLMGLLTFMVPLLLITLTVVYAVRLRNR